MLVETFTLHLLHTLNQGWPTQIGLWAALGKKVPKIQLFGPHFEENKGKSSKISKNL
jgi:hypothetical protein